MGCRLAVRRTPPTSMRMAQLPWRRHYPPTRRRVDHRTKVALAFDMATKRKTASRRRSSPKRGSQKRHSIKRRSGILYGKRTSQGRFKEMDEQGRSLATDRRRKAKAMVQPGFGDQGDQRVK